MSLPDVVQLTLQPPRSTAVVRTSDGRTHSLTGKAYGHVLSACTAVGALQHALAQPETRSLSLEPSTRRLTVEGGERVTPGGPLADWDEALMRDVLALVLREAGYAVDAGALMSRSAFWSQRYQAGDAGWDLGVAAPPLVRGMDALPKGRAVVVGCGRGHEVVALAARGFDALGLDFAAEAVAATQALLAQRKLKGRAEQADLFALPGAHAPFDLWVEHTCFCAIDPGRRDEYVEAAARSLKPGGRLLGLFYVHGRPGGPPFATTPDEVRARFAPRFDVESLALAPDSHPRRKGEEWLGVLVRR